MIEVLRHPTFLRLFSAQVVALVGTGLATTALALLAEGPLAQAIHGMRIYLRTPTVTPRSRLQGLFALNLCAAAGGAMVFVNTVVIVRQVLGGGDQQVALAYAMFGGGSMLIALLLPKFLDRLSDRTIMLSAGSAMTFVLIVATLLWIALPQSRGWPVLVFAWICLGMAYAGLVTPGGRLIRRSAHDADLPAVFAAQFSLSHACWLLTYPLAGWLGARADLGAAYIVLSCVAVVGLVVANRRWLPGERTA